MISVYQAEHIILNNAKLFGWQILPLSKAYGCLLREDIRGDRDQRPFDKALMDGIAIHTDAYNKGLREFPIEKIIAAGDRQYRLKHAHHCVQIMTGAMMPQGCNAVIPIEQVFIDSVTAALKGWTLVKLKQNIRLRASDSKKGQVLLKSSCQILTPQIGVLASVGKTKVKVSYKPSIAIISTGDELIDIHQQPKIYQTRLSNSHALQNLFEGSGLARTAIFHYPDNKNVLLKSILKNLKDFDI